jgi:hypothetical protein
VRYGGVLANTGLPLAFYIPSMLRNTPFIYCAPGSGFASSGYYYSASKRTIVGTVSVR